MPKVINWKIFNRENESPLLYKHREALQQGDTRYSLKNNIFFYKGHFVLPKASEQIPAIFHEFYDTTIEGHLGVIKTYKRIASQFHWKGMKKNTKRMVVDCKECQRSRYIALAPAGLLQPLPIPTQVCSEISTNFIEGLQKVEGYSTIKVVVDRLSKYAHFISLK